MARKAGEGVGRSSKFQVPSSREAPTSKLLIAQILIRGAWGFLTLGEIARACGAMPVKPDMLAVLARPRRKVKIFLWSLPRVASAARTYPGLFSGRPSGAANVL